MGDRYFKKHQQHCAECPKWRSTPVTLMMADLLAARLKINKPSFWSTRVDWPYTVKIGGGGLRNNGALYLNVLQRSTSRSSTHGHRLAPTGLAAIHPTTRQDVRNFLQLRCALPMCKARAQSKFVFCLKNMFLFLH